MGDHCRPALLDYHGYLFLISSLHPEPLFFCTLCLHITSPPPPKPYLFSRLLSSLLFPFVSMHCSLCAGFFFSCHYLDVILFVLSVRIRMLFLLIRSFYSFCSCFSLSVSCYSLFPLLSLLFSTGLPIFFCPLCPTLSDYHFIYRCNFLVRTNLSMSSQRNAVRLRVVDLEKSIKFYESLGMRVHQKRARNA